MRDRGKLSVRTIATMTAFGLAAVVVGLGVGKVVGRSNQTAERSVVAGDAASTSAQPSGSVSAAVDGTNPPNASKAPTTTAGPTTLIVGPGPAPTMTSFTPNARVPFQLVASGGSSSGTTELIDVAAGQRRVYAAGEAVVGASRVPSGGWLVWSNDRVRFFGGNLDGPARVFVAPRNGRGTVPGGVPRALPATDGHSAWLLWGATGERLLQRVDLSTGATLALLEPADDWYPVAAAGNNLVLANAPRNETLVVSGVGEQRRITGGLPVGASADRLLRFDCVDRNLIRNCLLHVSNLDGTADRIIPNPVVGDWSLTGSANPGMSTSVPTNAVSPSGSTAVFVVERERDANGYARAAQLVLVDLATGTTRALRDWPGTPVYWSSDGNWLLTVELLTDLANGVFRALSVDSNIAPVTELGVAVAPGQVPAGGG